MLPEVLVKELESRGFDVVELLTRELSLDPEIEYRAHLELSQKMLMEGEALIEKDPVQASEKLYKAAVEAVKAMAVKLGTNEAREALRQGRWTATLLFTAVTSISDKLSKPELRLWWRVAWFLHVEGFHEARLPIDEVRRDSQYVRAIVDLALSVTNP
ncbi:PaREP1 family protein [Vulcanisaeta thermophila]|uniref:PaREP1 family protein n=1 Tax=Vulcanisaeta thermophila TaxID=867917 RepID=UPI000853C122|nr:PaREP1 family protein [Vulcanisaeta thermophila]